MRNIIVIGASSKIGVSITNNFLKNGDHVIATYNKHDCFKKHHRLTKISLDLLNENLSASLISHINESYVDVVIFLAGIIIGNSLENYNDIDIDNVMTINFTAQAKLLKHILPYLKNNSQILMMSSISGQRGSFDPIYAASKAAIIGFVKALSASLAPKTRINAIAPGLIEDSAMFEQMSKERQNYHRNSIPLKQLLKINDLSKIIFDLTMPSWSHLNGACIDLNGGQYVR